MTHWFALLLLHPMVAGQILLELPGATPEQRAGVERGCEQALGEGECVALEEGEPESEPTSSSAQAGDSPRVRVVWSADGRHAQLLFPQASEAGFRELTFAEQDPPAARAEAVGLVIAAHVLGQRRLSPVDAPVPEPERPERPRWAADLVLSAGPGLDRGRARWGAGLRGAVRLGASPLYALAAFEGAHRFDTPRVHWWSGSLGLSVWLDTPWRYLGVQLHASAVAEHVTAQARDPDTGQLDRGAELRGGARLGVELVTCPHPRACLFGGLRLQGLYPEVSLELQGEPAGNLPPLGLGGVLGLRVAGAGAGG